MRKRLLRKLHRTKSKRGLSLVELIVGVTILVIVFGGTMSAMANGYTDTLYNAQQNKGAADGASLNEVIMEAVKAKGFADEEECAEYFAGDPNMDDTNAIHAAALEVDRELVQGDERKRCVMWPMTGSRFLISRGSIPSLRMPRAPWMEHFFPKEPSRVWRSAPLSKLSRAG